MDSLRRWMRDFPFPTVSSISSIHDLSLSDGSEKDHSFIHYLGGQNFAAKLLFKFSLRQFVGSMSGMRLFDTNVLSL
ncbi:MAG: hypothetical protein CMN02_12165 [Roseibacillus sp.]|nr:hypothetical protein [Roseibacillus sp.]